jgi:hypothetical protein
MLCRAVECSLLRAEVEVTNVDLSQILDFLVQ